MHEHARQVASLMGHLSNENRLIILCVLLDRPMTVQEIAPYVPDISMPALSQHLHRLKDAGLVSAEKHAQFVQYAIADTRLEKLMALLREEYCEGTPDFTH